MTWGSSPWGSGAWGGGLYGPVAVSPSTAVDEGGTLVYAGGGFQRNTHAIVELVSATFGIAQAYLPRKLGGVDGVGGKPASGNLPVADSNGAVLAFVMPQLPPGVYDLRITQPGGGPWTLVSAFTVVRRDFWTRLHTLRSNFPTPPDDAAVIGPKALAYEAKTLLEQAGEKVPVQRGMIHAIAAALLEADAVLYTWATRAPFRAGSVVRLWSTSALDVGQIATVKGYGVNGAPQSESLFLAGVAVVSGTPTWSEVVQVTLNASTAGSVTVADDAGTAPEAIVIAPGFLSKGAGVLQPGDTTIIVDGCWRFPDSGTVALQGETLDYSSKTMGPEANYLTLSAPVMLRHDEREVVADLTRNSTLYDKGRRALLPEYAEGANLDAVARRWGGVPRPPGLLDDDVWRALYQAIAYARVGTMHVLDLALQAILGAGNFEIIEDLITYTETADPNGGATRTPILNPGWPSTVWIKWGALAIGDDPRGKAFIQGGENTDQIGGQGAAKISTTALSVLTASPILSLFGVYRQADVDAGLGRSDNYVNLVATGANAGSVAAPGVRLSSVAGARFSASLTSPDPGKTIRLFGATDPLNEGIFLVTGISGTLGLWVDLETLPSKLEAYVDPGNLDLLQITQDQPLDSCPFGAEWVGRTVEVLSGLAGAPVIRVVSEFIDRRTVRVSADFPGSGTGLVWGHYPALQVDASVSWELIRAYFTGSTVTLPRALPGHPEQVVVDYTAIKSALVFVDPSIGNVLPEMTFPFYLSDSDGWLRSLLNDLVVAGVVPRVGNPHA